MRTSARRPRPVACFRGPGALPVLVRCVIIAVTGAFVLGWACQASRLSPASVLASPPPLFRGRPTGEPARPLTSGTAAPPFTLTDFRTGKKVSLDDFRGHRPVVLLFGSFG